MTVSLAFYRHKLHQVTTRTVQDVSEVFQGILLLRFESLHVPVDVEQHITVIRYRSTKTNFDSERADKNEATFCEEIYAVLSISF